MFLLQAESAGAAVPLVAGPGGLQGLRQGGGLQHGQVTALPPGHVLAHHLGHLVPAGDTLKVLTAFRGNRHLYSWHFISGSGMFSSRKSSRLSTMEGSR